MLQPLVRDGILKGIRGPRGGYTRAARPPGDITADDILRAARAPSEEAAECRPFPTSLARPSCARRLPKPSACSRPRLAAQYRGHEVRANSAQAQAKSAMDAQRLARYAELSAQRVHGLDSFGRIPRGKVERFAARRGGHRSRPGARLNAGDDPGGEREAAFWSSARRILAAFAPHFRNAARWRAPRAPRWRCRRLPLLVGLTARTSRARRLRSASCSSRVLTHHAGAHARRARAAKPWRATKSMALRAEIDRTQGFAAVRAAGAGGLGSGRRRPEILGDANRPAWRAAGRVLAFGTWLEPSARRHGTRGRDVACAKAAAS